MIYEVIIDISDVERRSFDFKRMFDESIPCKERIVRCRDCKWYAEANSLTGWNDVCNLTDSNVQPSGFCAWGERRIDTHAERLRGEGEAE